MSIHRRDDDPGRSGYSKSERGLVAVVPVRAGSKGLPGKNVRPLAGQPLYMHAVLQGLRVAGRVLISTDIEDIHQADLPVGCEVCPRPPSLSRDDTSMAPVIAHLIEVMALHNSTIVLLQATTPLRDDNDVQAAISLHTTQRHELVMSVVERNCGVLKYGLLEGDDFTAMRDPAFCFSNRQQLPPVYAPNGAVYVFSAASFIEAAGFPIDNIGAVEMPQERSVDIDNVNDFQLVEEALAASETR